MCCNTNLDLFNFNAFIKFGKILSICSQDHEQKKNDGMADGRNDGQPKSSIAPPFESGAKNRFSYNFGHFYYFPGMSENAYTFSIFLFRFYSNHDLLFLAFFSHVMSLLYWKLPY